MIELVSDYKIYFLCFSSFPADDKFAMKRVSIPKEDKIGKLQNVNSEQCSNVCNQYAGCNSYQYNAKDRICDLSNATQLSNKLKPNDGTWDTYILNPGQ